ncbi:gamma-glutamyl-gamma-aminobutyrate hydrolase family protein [uncultured Merdimmobilis sp.]|nr:gamma-glutamyl-gamma-aminobutyrate hydrolase family protein [uncultured Merdimmobilis sp.]
MKQPTIAVLPLGGKLYQRYMEHMYLSSLRRSGAQVVVLPPVVSQGELEWIARAYDGFLFTGGADVEPALYGEERILQCGPIDSVRDAMELPLFRLALREEKPILAICRGFQVMNVVFGGSLFQDIPTQRPGSLDHSQVEKLHGLAHSVRVESGTRLHRAVRANALRVNTLHHQGIDRLGGGLVVSARSEDGLIEGIESLDHRYVVGVQWHPELLSGLRPQHQRIFDEFAAHCQ